MDILTPTSSTKNPSLHSCNLSSLSISNPLGYQLFKSRIPFEVNKLKKCTIRSTLALNSVIAPPEIFKENGSVTTKISKGPANTCPFSPLDFLERASIVYGNCTSIVYNDTSYTWSQTYTRCKKLASSISSLGIKKGDVVSVLSPNIPAMYELQFAVPMSGAILNNINFRLDPRTLSVLLRHSESKLVFVDYQASSLLLEAISLFPSNLQRPKLVLIEDNCGDTPLESRNEFHNSYENVIDDGDQHFKWIAPESEWEPMTLNYTSGTTYAPKGVLHSHRSAFTMSVMGLIDWSVPKQPVFLWTLPIFHANGWGFCWAMAAVGGTNVCLRRSHDAALIYEAIQQHKVTHMCGAPVVLNMLSTYTKRKPLDSPVQILTAGAPPPAAVLDRTESLGFVISHGYGLTETGGPAVTCAWKQEWNSLTNSERATLKSRQGVKMVGFTDVDVVDPETGISIERNGMAVGEIVLKGGSVMLGYLKDGDLLFSFFFCSLNSQFIYLGHIHLIFRSVIKISIDMAAVPQLPATVQIPAAVTASAAAAAVGVTPPPSPNVVGGTGSGGVGQYSLYVGDLDTAVDEGQLYEVFNQVAPVLSVRVCRDQSRRASLGYAYVNFTSTQDATTARELLNFTQVNGKPMRIMFSHRDPSLRKSGYANVFIKNLDSSIDNKALQDTFGAFGTVLSCKVAVDSNGQSKGYGFVQFDQDEAAQKAINRLNGMLINDKQVYVGYFIRGQERRGNVCEKFTNVYVKNLPESTSDEDLKKLFEKYGTITSAVVMTDSSGKSKCFGFVNFETWDAAASAVEELNGSSLNENVLYVGKAQKKSEREADLRAKFEQERASRFEKLKGANLYLKNLDDTVNDENLKELFVEYGTITSCKVMRDAKGSSKGSGFVAFSTPEEATRALNEMNGKLIGRKPLFVAVAQRKDERRVWLQTHFARLRPTGLMTPPPGGMPGYHTGAPRLAPPQVYFGQGVEPQAAGFGYQQQFMPGLRPGVGPNFLLPYQFQRQGQHGRIGGRRGGNPHHQQQWNPGRFNPNGRNGMYPSISQGMMGSIMQAPFDASSAMTAPPMDIQRSNPVPPSTLASSLAFASPEDQHAMLGEQLFPLVEHIERDHAGKVTGMLLEMDQTEVLHLIESPDDLKEKVSEAMNVLRVAPASVGDKFGSLTLNE